MSASIYKWIVIYDDGRTEEKHVASLGDFADDLIEVPVAIIRTDLNSDNLKEAIVMSDLENAIRIIDELISEAQKESTWKIENALRCLKKELLKEQEARRLINDA